MTTFARRRGPRCSWSVRRLGRGSGCGVRSTLLVVDTVPNDGIEVRRSDGSEHTCRGPRSRLSSLLYRTVSVGGGEKLDPSDEL